ncbi:Flp pilus assembly protein CpaB [Mesobacterium pallidum]|uniref:Flp pilus assembly protein CpaB n=1 Tax=Mesobacterium pallidum TaxID=2872037 RepID=UPI001EE17896|nr:Flp pilus assembly protein CpaB [Mesobacterium pallidum]
MRLIFGLVLILGLGIAGFGTYMFIEYSQSIKSQLDEARKNSGTQIETVDVFVTKRPMRYGEPLEKADVARIKWPASAIPEGTFQDAEELFAGDELRTVIRAMEKGEPIMQVKVTEPGRDAGIVSRLQAGEYAFAINVNVQTGVSGFLRPGDRVDVYWTGRPEGRRASDLTMLIEQGIRVIAIDQTVDQDITQTQIPRTVTVAGTREQVARLQQAQGSGRLSLSLRGATDETTSAETITIDQNNLLGIQIAAPQEEAPIEKVCTIRTRRGAEVVELPIPCTN